MRQDRDGQGLVFGRSATRPFRHWAVLEHAQKAWKDAGLEYVTLHEARHTFASVMIAAGTPPKQLQTYMGRSSITVSFDRYGHLMPGSEREAADRLSAYLAAAQTSTDE